MRLLLKRLYPYIKPYLPRTIGALVFGLALALLKGVQVKLVQPIFDHGFGQDSTLYDALWYAGMFLLIGALQFPLRFLHFYWIRYVVDRATCDVRFDLYKKMQRLPMSFFSKNKQGVLLSHLLNDTITFSVGFRSAIDLIREPFTALVMLGIVIYTDWQLTLILLVVAPLFAIILSWSGKKVKEQQTIIQEDISQLTHNVNEGISGQKIAKAFNLQKYLQLRFNQVQNKFFDSQMRGTKIEEIAHPLVEFATAIAFAVVIVFAHFRIKSGAISIGDFITFLASLALLMDPIRKYSQANVKMHQAIAASMRIFNIFNIEEEKDSGKIDQHSFCKQIEINNIWFAYDREHYVLKNFSMKINKGEKVAVVGLSGSGKSTLINLLLGLYPLEKGEIKIDGIDYTDLSLKALRDIFGLVSQDIFLFHDSIEENLKVGATYSDYELENALKVAYADEFINKLPEGINTIIGDRGARLSGGQQQRVTIARAFLKNTDVFLFDEATSALDNESEKVVQKALEQLSNQKTVIAIAHRLSSIQDFDRIYVLKEGELIEEGTHHALMSLNGEYRKLYELSIKV